MDLDKGDGLIGLVAAALGGGGLWAWLAARSTAKSKQPADLQAALATFSAQLNDQAANIIATLTEQNATLRHENETLKATLSKTLNDFAAKIEELEEENRNCRGENNQMAQRINSLANYLRRSGIQIPEGGIEGAFIELSGDCAAVLIPGQKG